MQVDHSDLPTLRFKFMPTPTGALHVGHAWLIFAMAALVEGLRWAGRVVELVLVLDEINVNPQGTFDPEETERHGRRIVDDMERLGVPPDRAVFNGEAQFVEAAKDPKIRAIEPAAWHSGLDRPASYFLHNSLLDRHLGITHIIRGDDRREYTELYQECYRKIGCPVPMLGYVALVLRPKGVRISAREPYLVSSVLSRMSAEELFCALVDCCIDGPTQTGPPPDRASAVKRLLGDDWLPMLLEHRNSAAYERFFGRFVARPRVELEGLAV